MSSSFLNDDQNIKTEILPMESLDICLTPQLRRAAVSIFSNIAEGHGRMSDKDFSRFLYMALGSANEVEAQILLSENLNYLDKAVSEKIQKELQEIQAMLMAFIKKIT